jgi:Fe-S-cluster containining protein
VWFNDEEARAMAKATGCSEAEFRDKYARKLKDGWSLKEHQTQHGWDCVFLDRSTRPGLALCRLYQARPRQCRTWPFWPENLESEAAWDEARRATPCPGMGHGPLIRVEDIRISMARS